ncbi:DUF1674 domain-containing protein [Methylomonas sp. SURF-2]|uniref:DUF1674 domain-containing protein n=1 Tax=Methylomonas subterranea TaxID=2952225 RepID=A0ABT1TE52_9GAMM|nr:succinate dehydrogenase assembly factor 4 [Methylomonas sp. SURF-2]MCQ8103737.1 DUF1674 domain-containing protein [Methylomonas sp. SURF-2]
MTDKPAQTENAGGRPYPEPPLADTVRQNQAETTEINGPKGPEPTRYGDWERKGRCVDF